MAAERATRLAEDLEASRAAEAAALKRLAAETAAREDAVRRLAGEATAKAAALRCAATEKVRCCAGIQLITLVKTMQLPAVTSRLQCQTPTNAKLRSVYLTRRGVRESCNRNLAILRRKLRHAV